MARRSIPSWAWGCHSCDPVTSLTFVSYPARLRQRLVVLVPGLLVLGVLALVGNQKPKIIRFTGKPWA